MFKRLRRNKEREGLIAIDLHPDRIAVVHAVNEPGRRARVARGSVYALEDGQGLDVVLARAAREFDLKHHRCTTVLGDQDYKLLLTEAPDVPSTELKAALRWRVKDLIDFHINDATLDVFDLPGEKTRGVAREMYVVAARSDAIRRRIDQVESAGASLDVIDIPELAQRNLAALLPQDAEGVVLLVLQPRAGLITVTRHGLLYLARSLAFGWEALADGERQTEYFDQMVLEVQRSLDYFESHFRQAPVRHLAVAPMAVDVPGLIPHLASNLGLQVASVELGAIMDAAALPSDVAAWCLSSIGAALRREAVAL